MQAFQEEEQSSPGAREAQTPSGPGWGAPATAQDLGRGLLSWQLTRRGNDTNPAWVAFASYVSLHALPGRELACCAQRNQARRRLLSPHVTRRVCATAVMPSP